MNTKLFVGNLPFSLSEEQIQDIFARVGKVVSVTLPRDRETGRKRGFAFVEMESQQDAEQAIKNLNGHSVEGRDIVVNAAKDRPDRGGGSGSRPGSY